MLSFALAAFSAVFSVVDPFGVVPVYLAMTAADTREHKARTARRAAVALALTLTLFGLLGSYILRFFGISLAAFRIAGGVLLFLYAVDMLRAQRSRQRVTPEEEAEGIEKPDTSIFPLAIPMLSGPGAIATVMMLESRAQGVGEHLFVYAAIAVTSALTFAILLGASAAERRLGRTGMNVLHRVMGLLLAAIAVQFVVDGLAEALPGIVRTIR
ncbi:MAG TPA: NAAT family transporter [Polyangia bacterium]|nr:NAAT family transporter [Polyangia bacterium]